MNICILRKQGSKSTIDGIVRRIKKHTVTPILDGQVNGQTFDAIIRWNDAQTEMVAPHEVNTAAMVRLMNNKVETRRVLAQNGVSIPKTYFSKQEIQNSLGVHFPLVGRREFHSQGRHMKIIRGLKGLARDRFSAYWSEYIPKDREFRVFVFFGRVLGMCEKMPDDRNQIAWNNSLGNAVFETMKREEFPLGVAMLALKAAKALNVDFGAFDLMSLGDQHYVLEVNPGPTCSDYRQFLFSKAFKWVFRKIHRTGVKPPYYDLPNQPRDYRDILHSCLKKKREE